MPGRGCHTRRQGSSDTVTRRCRGKETVRTTRPGNRAARPIPRSPTTGPNHPSSRAVRNRRSAPPPQIQPLRGQKSIGCRPIHAASGFLTLSASGRKESTRSFSTRAGPVIRTRLPMADGRAMPDQLSRHCPRNYPPPSRKPAIESGGSGLVPQPKQTGSNLPQPKQADSNLPRPNAPQPKTNRFRHHLPGCGFSGRKGLFFQKKRIFVLSPIPIGPTLPQTDTKT